MALTGVEEKETGIEKGTSRLGSPPEHKVQSTAHTSSMESHHPSRSVFSELPTEILSLILGHFCFHCREPSGNLYASFPVGATQQPCWYSIDCQALYSICLLSTRFRDLAQPILYHQFAPGCGRSWNRDGSQWTRRFLPFLRTVALRPDLAAQVRRLYITQWFITCIIRGEAMFEAEATVKQVSRARGFQLSEFIQPFQLGGKSGHGPSRHWPYAMESLGMLLACLSKLNHISFSTLPYIACVPPDALRAAGVSSIPTQTLDITDGFSSPLSHTILELASSTLQTLNIDSYSGEQLVALPSPPMPSLKHICITQLTHAVISPDDLAIFLSRCTGLERFTYEHGKSSPVFISRHLSLRPTPVYMYTAKLSIYRDFLNSNAVEQLLQHKATLQALHLDVRISPRDDRWHNTKQSKVSPDLLTALPTFPVLQHLFLNTLLIYTSSDNDSTQGPESHDNLLTDILPQSIASLKLANNYHTIDTKISARLSSSLVGLARAVERGQFRHLKNVYCDLAQELEGSVTEAFESAGVEFRYACWPFLGGAPRRRLLDEPVDILWLAGDEYGG